MRIAGFFKERIIMAGNRRRKSSDNPTRKKTIKYKSIFNFYADSNRTHLAYNITRLDIGNYDRQSCKRWTTNIKYEPKHKVKVHKPKLSF